MPNGIDLTGKTFGEWTVIERVKRIPGEKGSIKWKCRCSCGSINIIPGNSLRNGTSTKCRECANKRKAIDMTEKEINGIKVIERVYEYNKNSGEAKWRCICPSCKRDDWIIKGSSLRGGVKKCQKCSSLESLSKIKTPYFKDLTNKRFGRLVVIEPTKDRLGTSVVWKCRCDCGRIAYKASSYLINGDTSSCGLCKYISKGEEKIIKILEENNIEYQKEKRVTINGKTYRFDFYLPQYDCYIEYDGKQHFIENQWEPLENVRNRDNIKNNWCIENNKKLIRIPYTEYKKITKEDLIFETSNYIFYGEEKLNDE